MPSGSMICFNLVVVVPSNLAAAGIE